MPRRTIDEIVQWLSEETQTKSVLKAMETVTSVVLPEGDGAYAVRESVSNSALNASSPS